MFIFVILSCLFPAALWSPVGKGLTSLLSCMLLFSWCSFFTFPSGVLGQVCYLIVLIPDLCLPLYLYSVLLSLSNQYNKHTKLSNHMALSTNGQHLIKLIMLIGFSTVKFLLYPQAQTSYEIPGHLSQVWVVTWLLFGYTVRKNVWLLSHNDVLRERK